MKLKLSQIMSGFPAGFVLGLALMVLSAGCAKRFLIPRGAEIPESKWAYARKDVYATAKMESDFGGQLNTIWDQKTSEMPTSPITISINRLIYCGSTGKIRFYDPETGKFVGRVKNKEPIETGILINDSLGFFAYGFMRSRLVCLDLHNQAEVWKRDLKEVSAPPIIIENRLYLTADTGMAACIDCLTGKEIWRQWIGSKSPAGPSYDSGIVLYPSNKGVLTGLSDKRGEIVFQTNLDEPLMSKAAVGDKIYLSGANGGFFALDKQTGKSLWAKEFPWPIWTSPVVDDTTIFIGDNGGFLRALNSNDGRTIWEFKTGGVIVSSPIVLGNYVLFASLDKNIYCLDKKTGLLVSKRELKHEVRLPLVSDGHHIYLADQDGEIHCFGD